MSEAGYSREDYYIHSDAALSGMIIPFVMNHKASILLMVLILLRYQVIKLLVQKYQVALY